MRFSPRVVIFHKIKKITFFVLLQQRVKYNLKSDMKRKAVWAMHGSWLALPIIVT